MRSSSETVASIAGVLGATVLGDTSVAIHDVTHDSRAVGPGVLFVAVRGFTRDGHEFVSDVERAGAAAVLVDHPMDVSLPQIIVDDTRMTMGRVAAFVHGLPSDRLSVIGITGTNGKTSVTHMIEAIERSAGLVCGVVGTLGIRVGDTVIESDRTTPEAPDFQRILSTIADLGATTAAVEVSSHALQLGRVDGTHFSVGAFTNLSQDHLDFHGDMDTYFEAKVKLFDPVRTDRAVVFVDDPWGARLVERIDLPCTTVSIAGSADLTGAILRADLAGSTVHVASDGAEADVRIGAAGRFSVANALVAAGCSLAAGLSFDEVVHGMGAIQPIPGRFELVQHPGAPAVVVDYSHTPAGIEAAIETARPLTKGRLIAVIGAGGDRDRAKRPLMGSAASAADVVIVTSDNPRSEPPAAIMAEVMAGVTAPNEAIEDRRLAIRRAIGLAADIDTILVMGKGHESYQEVAGVKRPFHDATVAREELARAAGQRS